MFSQLRPDSFQPPRWIIEERRPQRHADFDRTMRQARTARDDAKRLDLRLPEWAAALLTATYIPVSGWPDYHQLFLVIRERMVPRDLPQQLDVVVANAPRAPPACAAIRCSAPTVRPPPPPPSEPAPPPPPPLPIEDDRCAPSAVRTTVEVATQTDYLMVTAVERPSWIRSENPTTGRKLWINNLTGESFYEDDPTPWKCWHCGTSGQRYWVKMSEGADWETLPAFWE